MLTYIKQHIYDLGLLLLSFIVCLHFPQNPFTRTYFGDPAVYEFFGKNLIEGVMPYKDIFDHKGPLVYLWHALGYKIYPMYGAWLLELIWLFLSFKLLFFIIKKYIKPQKAFYIISIVLFTFFLFDTIGNSESLSLLPITYFIYIAQKYIDTNKLTAKDAFIIGITSSLLLMIKPIHLVTPFIICLFIVITQLKDKKYQEFVTFAGYGLIGFLLPASLILFWLYQNDALQSFYNAYIEFNLLYTKLFSAKKTFFNILKTFLSLAEIIIALVSIAVILFQRNTFSLKQKKFIYLIIIAYCFTFIANIIPKNFFEHYMFVLLPLTLSLVTFAIKSIKTPVLQKSILQFLLIFSIYLFYTHINFSSRYQTFSTQNYREITQILQKHIPPHMTYASTHTDFCALYMYSQRRPSTKYPLIEFAYRVSPQLVEEEFKQKKPPYILADIYHPYPDLITEDYELIEEYERFLLYKRKN